MRRFRDLFDAARPLIGVVHVAALPGSPRHSLAMDEIRRRALTDARAYLANGADGIILENFGDAPFHRDAIEPQVVAALAVIASDAKRLAGRRPVGVNVLRNASSAALGVAVGAGLDFIRVNVLAGVAVADQGWLEGDAASLMRLRRALLADVQVLADLRVKHAAPLREGAVEIEVEELTERALADAVLVTGETTGRPPSAEWLERVAGAASRHPVLVASGVTAEGIGELSAADGFIVGSSLKTGGRIENPVDGMRVKRLKAAIVALRRSRSAKRQSGATQGGRKRD